MFTLIPVGAFGFVKSILFLLLCFIFIVAIVFRYNEKFKLSSVLNVLILPILLLIQTLNSLFQGFYEKELLIEFKSFLGLYLTIIALIYLYHIEKDKVFHYTIVKAHALYIMLKILLVFSYFFELETGVFLIELLENEPGIDLYYYGKFIRLVFVNDILSPIILLFLLVDKNIKRKGFYSILMLVNILLTFSRYHILITIIGMFLFWLLYRELPYRLSKLIPLLVLCVVILIISRFEFYTAMMDLWRLRIFSEGFLSTSEKLYQYSLFYEKILEERTFVGRGLGSYIFDYIRDERIKYGYEAFVMLLIYQFGVIGFSLLLYLYFVPFVKDFHLLKKRESLYMLALLIFLISNMLVNPQVLNSFFSIAYFYLYTGKELIKTKKSSFNGE